jgi:N-glycosylase/DNA lyase
LKKSSTADIIEKKLESFREKRNQSEDDIFSELCYCILTANCSAESCLAIQQTLDTNFNRYNAESLATTLKSHHYRFPNTRAQYIASALQFKHEILDILANSEHAQRREWFVKHIKGIGYKEASHFLRNIGLFDYAILDRHILSVLAFQGIIAMPKTLTKNSYLSIEETMKTIAEKTDLSLGCLDLYLWYMKTGKILK